MRKINQLFLAILVCLSFTNYSNAQSGDWVWLKGEKFGESLGSYGTIGVSSPANEPPSRYQAAYWKDLNGNFWMFGGNPNYNDLWKYNPITNEWTWIKGPKLSTQWVFLLLSTARRLWVLALIAGQMLPEICGYSPEPIWVVAPIQTFCGDIILLLMNGPG
jgi:hypothetical protein